MSKPIDRRSMTQSIGGKVTREPKVQEGAERGKFYWWKQADNDEALAQEVAATIKFIQKHQSTRTEQLTISTRLYGNNNAYNLLGAAFTRSSSATSTPSSSRISFNLCASVIDTLTAQIARNKIVPTFITSGGIWGMQRKAENLSKFVEGLFYEQDMHHKGVYQFRDAATWGDGILHIYRNSKNRAAIERTLPHEWIVDLVESLVTDKPKQLHRLKLADRGVVMDMFPDKEEQIAMASPASYEQIGGDGTAADLVLLSESWHLKSGEDADDGLRVITLMDNAEVLCKDEYKKDYYPIAILPYSKRLLGFWGQGACERLQNIQGEVNRSMILEQKSRWMQASFKILVENGSKVVSQHLNNEVGSIIHYSGTPPQYVTPPAINGDNQGYVDGLIAKGYQQEGVSQMSANSMVPLGIKSGAALRTYDQIAEDRQLFIAQSVERAQLEVARQCIEIVKEVFEEIGQYQVRYPNTNFVESIDWKDVNLKEDEYWLKAFPTSELPEEPAAKLETVQEYMQAGLITPRAGRRLLRMPDVEMSDKLANAAEDLIMKSIEDIIYDGKKNIRPDAEWDLQLAKEISLQYMNYAKLNNCPPKRIQMLRDFMSYINDELGLTAPPLAPPPNGAPSNVIPMANPQPTPTSPMIPNINQTA